MSTTTHYNAMAHVSGIHMHPNEAVRWQDCAPRPRGSAPIAWWWAPEPGAQHAGHDAFWKTPNPMPDLPRVRTAPQPFMLPSCPFHTMCMHSSVQERD